jgi:hypothetical protein
LKRRIEFETLRKRGRFYFLAITTSKFYQQQESSWTTIERIHHTKSKMYSLPMIFTSPEKRNDEETLTVPQMDYSDVADRIHVMRLQEESTYKHIDYFNQELHEAPPAADENCRENMARWCYEVIALYKLRRETVAISMSYLDRFMATPEGAVALLDNNIYQLAAITTLYMAIKLFEPGMVELSWLSKELVDGRYMEAEFIEMEIKILHALNWHMHDPTPASFVNHLLALLPKAAQSVNTALMAAIIDYSLYQTEIAVFDYKLETQNASSIAIAALANAFSYIGSHFLPMNTIDDFLCAITTTTGVKIYSYRIANVRYRLSEQFFSRTGKRLLAATKLTIAFCDKDASSGEEPVCEVNPRLRQKRRVSLTTSSSPVSVTANGAKYH